LQHFTYLQIIAAGYITDDRDMCIFSQQLSTTIQEFESTFNTDTFSKI